jgi:hypothetical protein
LALAALLAARQPAQQPPAPQAQLATQQAASDSAQVPSEVPIDRATLAKRVPPKPGEICIVCNHPVDEDDVVFQARGHRLPLHLGELSPDVRGQLEGLLAQLEPRGAFIGAGQGQAALSKAWFFVGFYILVGLVFAALCAHRALHTGHSAAAWFVIGLLLNVLGYLLLLTRPGREVQALAGVPAGLRKVAATYAPEPCPGCGTLNHPSASACSGCGGKLQPKTVSEVARAGLRTA